MQVRDDRKRELITATAAKLFATQPYHKVRLDDVAAEAGVGKGTVYTYFANKEELYFSLIGNGFASLVDGLETRLQTHGGSAIEQLRIIIGNLVQFGVNHPHLYELMRNATPDRDDSQWQEKYLLLMKLIERTIRNGMASGELDDSHPELTAAYIPGIIRSAMLLGRPNVAGDVLVDHLVGLLERGLAPALATNSAAWGSKRDPKESGVNI